MKYIILLIVLMYGCVPARYERDPETGIRYRITNERFYTGYTGCPEARCIDEKDTLRR